MSQKVPCCGKCSDIGFCRTTASCCLECHFVFEERVACPYLPAQVRADLRAQHRRLIDAGFPAAEVARHAVNEMHMFRKHCPQEIVELIETDHEEYEAGRLMSRDTARR